jgi:transcriptional regulator with XRE-family HTH domain
MKHMDLAAVLADQQVAPAELARRLGWKTSNVTRLVAGRHQPNFGNAVLIADALGVPLDALRSRQEPHAGLDGRGPSQNQQPDTDHGANQDPCPAPHGG